MKIDEEKQTEKHSNTINQLSTIFKNEEIRLIH